MIHLLKYVFIYQYLLDILHSILTENLPCPTNILLLILIIIVSSLGKENCTLEGSVKIDFRSI